MQGGVQILIQLPTTQMVALALLQQIVFTQQEVLNLHYLMEVD